MSTPDIRIFDWPQQDNSACSSQHGLFNSDALADAGRLDGNEPFCISIDDKHYLAFKINATAVVGGMSLRDMYALLKNNSQVLNTLTAMGVRALSLTSLNAENDHNVLQVLLNQQCKLRFEFLLDTDEYSISKISSNHKRNIKKCEKANAEVVFPGDSPAVRNHIDLVNANLSKKGVGGLSNSPEYFCSLLERGEAILAQVRMADQLLASTFFYSNRDYCYYHSSGTSESGKQSGAAHFLVDRMIKEMRRCEIRYLNLGGCTSGQSGLYRFKLGFRPETRVLLAAKRPLVFGVRHKLRSLLSMGKNGIFRAAHTQYYVKNTLDMSPGAQSNYSFSELSFDTLLQSVASNPEIGDSLANLCGSMASCYGLYGSKQQLIALGFVSLVDAEKTSVHSDKSTAPHIAEISNIYVIREMRNKGIGEALITHLEAEIVKAGCSRAYTKIAVDNLAAQSLFNSRSFLKAGEETSISTPLIPGKQHTIGKFEL